MERQRRGTILLRGNIYLWRMLEYSEETSITSAVPTKYRHLMMLVMVLVTKLRVIWSPTDLSLILVSLPHRRLKLTAVMSCNKQVFKELEPAIV